MKLQITGSITEVDESTPHQVSFAQLSIKIQQFL